MLSVRGGQVQIGVEAPAPGMGEAPTLVPTALPLGTHFLWHLLTALVLYLATQALLLNWPDGPDGTGTSPGRRWP